jgi:predicted  nucleic acid-binding Zn-ribbon protein
MNEDDATKELSDRELLILLHRAVTELNEKVGKLEAKAYDTQPLPVNFDARFTALEERMAALEQNLVGFRRETKANFKLLREEFVQEKLVRTDLEERIERLEGPPH